MSGENNEISFTLYMPVKKSKELTLYKNSKSYYEFSSSSYINLSLKVSDYISVRSNANTDNIDVTVQNDNNFSIDVIKKTDKKQVEEKTHIAAKSTKSITVMQSNKISVLKAETKTNETEKKSSPENPLAAESDIKPSKHEVEIKLLKNEGEKEKEGEKKRSKRELEDGQAGTLIPKIPLVIFRISADPGTKLKVGLVLSEVDSKPFYQIHEVEFKKSDSAKFSSKETDGTVKVESTSDDNYFTIESGGNVKIKNINSFTIKITIKNDSEFTVFYLDSQKTTQKYLKLSPNVSRVFVTKKRQLPGFENTTETAKFTLDVYGEEGIQLLKNGNSYFSFTKKGLSGVQVHLKDNDTIDIGPDEDFGVDEDLKVPTQYTIASSEVRTKKRRLIVRNRNDFYITVIAALNKDFKTYTIASFSNSFIFFGKDACKLYMLK